MRDKNQTTNLIKFSEELGHQVLNRLSESSLRTAVSDSTTVLVLDQQKVQVLYPRDFVSLRSLSVALWYFPEFLRWRILLDLREKSFFCFTDKQFLEIQILLSSKENMEFYLFETKRYSAREIFGNIVGSHLKTSLKQLSIKEKVPGPVAKKERHRGYRDKGSLRPPHQWLEKGDWSLTEKQNEIDRKKLNRQLLTSTISEIVTKSRLSKSRI